MANANLGELECPCCGSAAHVRESKTKKAYLMCSNPNCGFQGFARGGDSDKALRTKMKPCAAAVAAEAVDEMAEPDTKQSEAPAMPPPEKKGGMSQWWGEGWK